MKTWVLYSCLNLTTQKSSLGLLHTCTHTHTHTHYTLYSNINIMIVHHMLHNLLACVKSDRDKAPTVSPSGGSSACTANLAHWINIRFIAKRVMPFITIVSVCNKLVFCGWIPWIDCLWIELIVRGLYSPNYQLTFAIASTHDSKRWNYFGSFSSEKWRAT